MIQTRQSDRKMYGRFSHCAWSCCMTKSFAERTTSCFCARYRLNTYFHVSWHCIAQLRIYAHVDSVALALLRKFFTRVVSSVDCWSLCPSLSNVRRPLHTGFFARVSHRNSRMQQFQRKPHIFRPLSDAEYVVLSVERLIAREVR